jgi:hypothetical protein
MAISWRAVNHYTSIHQALTGSVDIIDFIGQVTEVSAFPIVLRLALFWRPVIGQFNQWGLGLLGIFSVAGGGEKNQSKTTFGDFVSIELCEPKSGAVKVEGFF